MVPLTIVFDIYVVRGLLICLFVYEPKIGRPQRFTVYIITHNLGMLLNRGHEITLLHVA